MLIASMYTGKTKIFYLCEKNNLSQRFSSFLKISASIRKCIPFLGLIIILCYPRVHVYAQATNPFEIITTDTTEISKARLDSGEIEGTAPQSKEQNERVPSFNANKSDNPFEVNHITIKRFKTDLTEVKDKRLIAQSTSLFIFLVIAAFIFVLSLLIRRDIVQACFRMLLNANYQKLMMREDNNGVKQEYLLLFIAFIFNFSVFIFKIAQDFFNVNNLPAIWSILLGVTVVFSLKHLLIYLTGIIFGLQADFENYNFLFLVYNICFGIILLPVLPFYVFGPEKLGLFLGFMIMGLLFFLYIALVLRVLINSLNLVSSSLFLFFVYLCALELVPVLMLIRILEG
jgi:hypothetical protein